MAEGSMGITGRNRILGTLQRVVLFAALWASLVGADPEGLALGLAVVPAAVALSLRLMPPRRPVRAGRLLAALPGFHARSVLGGLDVAARAVAPRMPLAPGWLRAPVALPPGGRVTMGASLSLMPGTLVAGAEGGSLLVHVLDARTDHSSALRAEEARIARLHFPAAPPDAPPAGTAPPPPGPGSAPPGPGPAPAGPGSAPGGPGSAPGGPGFAPGAAPAGTGSALAGHDAPATGADPAPRGAGAAGRGAP